MINKKDAIDQFRHMLKVYNRINKTTLTKITFSALKNFNDSHPEMAITEDQKVSISKRVAGQIYNDLMHNLKMVKDES